MPNDEGYDTLETEEKDLVTLAEGAPSGKEILEECFLLARTLLEKNTKYKDSALSPMRVFCKADTDTQLRARLDDKLSRIAQGSFNDGEITDLDFAGYIMLLRVWQKRKARGIE